MTTLCHGNSSARDGNKRILVVAANLPTPDRASGDLRLSLLLKALTDRFDVHYCAYGAEGQRLRLGLEAFDRYAKDLQAMNVVVHLLDPVEVVQSLTFDVIVYEFHSAAKQYMNELRFRQPQARTVVDTVDIHFNRLASRARVTGLAADRREAKAEKALELRIYRQADALIVVSEVERALIEASGVRVPQFVISNFHVLTKFAANRVPHADLRLIFVGSFAHEPNVDAILYFCGEVWPMVKARLPRATLTVVGGGAPASVRALEGDGVRIAGYVPDLAQIFAESDISIAPLRYGGGIKGKVGEAMAVGLPVVSTSVGVEGMGVIAEQEALIADDPTQFAEAIVRLAADFDLYASLRSSARTLIARTLSADRVGALACQAMEQIVELRAGSLALNQRASRVVRNLYQRHIGWRI